ncbi:MAG: RNA 2',3'-cyclic phosphodiesterase [Alcaligenaceae bacterium]|nr:RNA 2',3'-cyclic phosphodiesterase [Alcaligenaceae bacterium]
MSDPGNHSHHQGAMGAHSASRRQFIGLWPDARTVQALSAWATKAHALCGGRIMRPDTLHLTLAFLGNVQATQVADLSAAVPAWRVHTGLLELTRLGRFKGPRIVWAGPADARVGWLDELHTELWGRLGRLGFVPPAEPFRPHVSLLRNAGLGDVSRLAVAPPIVWTPSRCVLVASAPAATDSYYEVLAEAP